MSALLPALLLLLGGCGGDVATQTQEKAREAQEEANAKIDDAQEVASQTMRDAQAQADKEIAAAQADFDTAREAYRHDLSTRLAALDEKIAGLEAKALVANGKAQADLDIKLQEVRARRAAFAADAAAIGDAMAVNWNETKARVEAAFTELKDRVDKAG